MPRRPPQVAIKRWFDPARGAEVEAEFHREALTHSDLRHPNVVQFLGVCRQPPELLMVTGKRRNMRIDCATKHLVPTSFAVQGVIGQSPIGAICIRYNPPRLPVPTELLPYSLEQVLYQPQLASRLTPGKVSGPRHARGHDLCPGPMMMAWHASLMCGSLPVRTSTQRRLPSIPSADALALFRPHLPGGSHGTGRGQRPLFPALA